MAYPIYQLPAHQLRSPRSSPVPRPRSTISSPSPLCRDREMLGVPRLCPYSENKCIPMPGVEFSAASLSLLAKILTALLLLFLWSFFGIFLLEIKSFYILPPYIHHGDDVFDASKQRPLQTYQDIMDSNGFYWIPMDTNR